MTAAVGAALTLLGAVILFALQTIQGNIEDHRNYHRQWHADLVDALSDLEMLMILLSATLRDTDGRMFARSLAVFKDLYGDRSLYWRLTRIERGHPDASVRARLKIVLYGVVNLASAVFESGLKLPGEAKATPERIALVENVIRTMRPVVDDLGGQVHNSGSMAHPLSWPFSLARRRRRSRTASRATPRTEVVPAPGGEHTREPRQGHRVRIR